MTIWNLGSINIDNTYAMHHIVAPGETLAATELLTGLGGKGANMSVAMVRAGAKVAHIGAVGRDLDWPVARLAEYGVDTGFIASSDVATGHAIITVDRAGENAIIVYPGANVVVPIEAVKAALGEARPGDKLVMQNETNLQAETARLAHEAGLWVAYAAAPFSAESVAAVLPYIDFLILNEIEAAQLQDATGKAPDQLGVRDVVVTLGGDGAAWYDGANAQKHVFPAVKVTPVDTTGAGDTVTGYILAGLDNGLSMPEAITLAMKAGALMVTRHGTADVIPQLGEVQAFQP
ncbi:ribokinase [Ketogulonicigenium robustum]|uniref:Ribokinase n=1 Tax=Ketogulonicigenium robustum TaxID=92947 RepID=A0A1W6P2M7_9RHOB|nr:ribokinase [Ketogulonicigenium robustum]ARO15683.1 ribokinase [Ketogulonicigenium robustum]